MEKTIPERLWIGFKFGLIDLALTFFVIVPLLFLTGIGSKLPVIVDKNEPFTVMLFLEMVVLAPFFEEFVFRFLPISFTRLVTSNVMVLWSVIIIASILFGRAHGSWWNVFAQGVGGIIFAFAFLRGGYVSSVAAHATANGVLFFIALLDSLLRSYNAPAIPDVLSNLMPQALLFLR